MAGLHRWRCRPKTYLIRSPKTLIAADRGYAGRHVWARPGLKVPGGMMRGPKERRTEPARQPHCKVVDGAKKDSHQDRNRYRCKADDPPLLRRLKAERSQHAQTTNRERIDDSGLYEVKRKGNPSKKIAEPVLKQTPPRGEQCDAGDQTHRCGHIFQIRPRLGQQGEN